MLNRNAKITKIKILKTDYKIKIKTLKKIKNSENDIKFLKDQLKQQIKLIKLKK